MYLRVKLSAGIDPVALSMLNKRGIDPFSGGKKFVASVAAVFHQSGKCVKV